MEKINVKNELDGQYINLLKDILDNGTKKQTRTGTDSISIFGRQIRHKMSDGFPLLTTKKMAWKSIVTELLWFLRGDTNIKFLLDNDCHIWDGDCYQAYVKKHKHAIRTEGDRSELVIQSLETQLIYTREEFINKIKTDDEFAKKWGDLGPIYGKQWRSWESNQTTDGAEYNSYNDWISIDQIANLISELKTNPDSRRLMVSAWNVGELDQMTLPPCHYGFQVYTRELNRLERIQLGLKAGWEPKGFIENFVHEDLDGWNIPTRAISLMWNQRSVDVPLGLPFNIASYGLLLEIIAKAVNMVPDELIGNLGDCHIYENQIDGIKEQIGRELSLEERAKLLSIRIGREIKETTLHGEGQFKTEVTQDANAFNIPKRTREPYPLPTLNINTEFWPTESGESGVGPLVDNVEWLIRGMEITDFQVENYQSHPSIKIPLSN